MVPLSTPPGEVLEPYLGSQITAMRRRLSENNHQGSLDGLCAQHILNYDGGLAWNVGLAAGSWLADNADQLSDAGPLAAIGYALATPGSATDQLMRVTPEALKRFMQRDHLRGGGKLAFVRDTRILLGVSLAVLALKKEMPEAAPWLASTLKDPRLEPADRFHELLQQHVLVTVSGAPSEPLDLSRLDGAELALAHWMLSEGTARVPDPSAHQHLSVLVMREALLADPAELTVPQTALLMRAAQSITAASIDRALLSRNHLSAMMRRFPAAMRRWRWDDSDKKKPICWPITSEREVQDVLLVMLLPVFDDIIDEDTSPKFGHASTRSDFGIPSLRLLIEVKYVYHGNTAEFRDVEQQVMIDSIAYLKRSTIYDEIAVLIYDASASVEHHELTRRTLMEVPGIADVVIVSRPGVLASQAATARAPTPMQKKAAPVKKRAVKSRAPSDGTIPS